MTLNECTYKKSLIVIGLLVLFLSCNKENNSNTPLNGSSNDAFVSAVDISRFPEIEGAQAIFLDEDGQPSAFLEVLKQNGVNTIRLRLWVNPSDGHSGFQEVKQFSKRLKSLGFQIWLSVHYSDTWADPGNQETPLTWQNISFTALQDSVQAYTQRVVEAIQPEYIQIGNEINAGFLFPEGNLNIYPNQCKALLSTAMASVRKSSPNSKIILHYAGILGSAWFYNQMDGLDYDVIGLSYYPIWHGKNLDSLSNNMEQLAQAHNKEVLLAETAYPFSLAWNDWTNNIVGLEEHLILPEYPASPAAQKAFVGKVVQLVKDNPKGIGFCYWGGELIAWKGNEATDASPWENQALFDFNNKALPVLEEFTH